MYDKSMITIRRGQRYTSGFTIVEIIVVIVIIGILAALGTVAYNGLQKRAAGNAVLSDIENASAIVEQYAAKNNGQFPDNTYLQANLTKSSGVNISITTKETLPALPGGGTPGGSANQPNELTKSYCVAGTSTKYSDIMYSFSSSDLKTKQGNCS